MSQTLATLDRINYYQFPEYIFVIRVIVPMPGCFSLFLFFPQLTFHELKNLVPGSLPAGGSAGPLVPWE